MSKIKDLILKNPKIKNELIDFFTVALISILFLIPYISEDFLSMEHDTMFHISRIEGLAQALKQGTLFPGLYPLKNIKFGYASPLFYCDIFLIPFSFLYNCGFSLAFVYKLLIFIVTFFNIYVVLKFILKLTDNFPTAVFTSIAFCFANYHITDVYVRGALGEVMAMPFIALCLFALYTMLEEKNPKGGITLCIGVSGLILTHNLTFILAMVMILIIVLFYINKLNRSIILSICKSMLFSFLITSWFTLPMLEQLESQFFVLNIRNLVFNLENYSLPLWKYFANKTIFGLGMNNTKKSEQMLVNLGYTIPIFSLLFPIISFFKKKKITRFVLATLILGIIFMILPWDGFPWASWSKLRFLQFPWRLMTISLALLIVPTALTFSYITEKNTIIPAVIITAVLCEGLVHIAPAFNRPFGIFSKIEYSQLISGKLLDPFSSHQYVYVELAGGDYLPINSPDFSQTPRKIYDSSEKPLDIDFTQDYDEFSFTIDNLPEDNIVELPLTYYKGYSCYLNGIPVEVTSSNRALVQLTLSETGEVLVKYEGTPYRKYCMIISLISFILLCFGLIKEKILKKES